MDPWRKRRPRFVPFLVVLLSAISLSGCATTAKFERNLQSWVGADVNAAILQFGPPSNTYHLPNGQVMYTWLWVGGTVITANYNHYLNMVTGGAVQRWCEVSFTTTGSRISFWRWEGNQCRSR